MVVVTAGVVAALGVRASVVAALGVATGVAAALGVATGVAGVRAGSLGRDLKRQRGRQLP